MPTLDFPGMLTIVIAGALVLTPFLQDQREHPVAPASARASRAAAPPAPATAANPLPVRPAG